ncbi:hypothetical protein ACFV1T_13350, partial [Streptomyces vinaceus]
AAHVGAVAPAGPAARRRPRPAAASPTPSSAAAGAPVVSADPVPPAPEEALTALADAERSLAEARTVTLAGAPGELARLLASVAACGAVHAYLLTSSQGAKP